MNSTHTYPILIAALCGLTFLPVSADAAPQYTVTDLGTLGGVTSLGFGLNGAGEVTGYSTLTGSSIRHAVRWSGGPGTDLGTLGGTDSTGYDINASGQVAGHSQLTGNTATHAVRWT